MKKNTEIASTTFSFLYFFIQILSFCATFLRLQILLIWKHVFCFVIWYRANGEMFNNLFFFNPFPNDNL